MPFHFNSYLSRNVALRIAILDDSLCEALLDFALLFRNSLLMQNVNHFNHQSKITIHFCDSGSGKTYVALHICMKHLGGSEKKVVFLVPTVPLVQQHYTLFSW